MTRSTGPSLYPDPWEARKGSCFLPERQKMPRGEVCNKLHLWPKGQGQKDSIFKESKILGGMGKGWEVGERVGRWGGGGRVVMR